MGKNISYSQIKSLIKAVKDKKLTKMLKRGPPPNVKVAVTATV
jgi:hypothetical protein